MHNLFKIFQEHERTKSKYLKKMLPILYNNYVKQQGLHIDKKSKKKLQAQKGKVIAKQTQHR